MYEMRNCVLCGTPFVSNHPRKIFCSAQHAMKAANMRYRHRGKQNIRDTEKVLQHVEIPIADSPTQTEQSKESETIMDILRDIQGKESK